MANGFPVKANYATGDVLTATNMNELSATVNYLQYMPPRNPVLNSSFSVWQRGTSFSNPSSTATAYCADRWSFWRPSGFTTGITVSRQATGDTTNLPNIQYCARVQRTAANTSLLNLYFAQNFESVNSIPFAGKTYTLSFYARKGADFSASGSTLNANVSYGTGTDQNIITGLTGETATGGGTFTLTTTWQRFSVSGTIGTNATQIVPVIYYTPVGTAGTNDYFEITGVQLELGSVANTYMPNQPTYQGELAACQRYYWRWTAGGTYRFTGAGAAYSTTQASIYIPYPVTMRVGATALDTSGMTCHLLKNDSYNSSGSFSLANQQESNAQVIYTHGSGIFAAGDFVNLSNAATSTGYIGFTAEL